MKRTIRIAFRDFWHPDSEEVVRDENPIYRLLGKRFDVELSDDPDFLVYSCYGTEFLKFDCTRIQFIPENERPDFSECDYAFSFDYPVTERNYRLPLYKMYGYFDRIYQKGQDLGDVSQRRFCNFVYSNAKARERLEFLDLLSRYKRVDCGGKLRNNMGGRVRDKLEFLSKYKFTIAFENSSHPGYTTEKIMDALVANTVPIYWGNPLVGRDFNPESLINCHDFDSFEAVVDHVIEVDRDDDLLLKYLQAPAFVDNEPNEFIREDNVLDRFEAIFEAGSESDAASSVDRLRYFVDPRTYWFKLRRLKYLVLDAVR